MTETQEKTETGKLPAIHTRAMLCSLRISSWTARKYDKRISEQVNKEHGAASDAGRYNKMLIPADAPSYKELTRVVSEARDIHYKQTLAWSDEGWRLLPTKNYMTYAPEMRAVKEKFEAALDRFMDDYPTLREAARVRLNGMYRDEDYPSGIDLLNRFLFRIEYSPLPAEGDFRVKLAGDEIRELESRTSQRIQHAVEEAQKDARDRLYECVSHIYERLSDPTAVFRDSLILNAQEMCDMLVRLNVTDDQQLEGLRRAVEQQIATAEPESLRENKRLRAQTAQSAADILEQMRGVYGQQ